MLGILFDYAQRKCPSASLQTWRQILLCPCFTAHAHMHSCILCVHTHAKPTYPSWERSSRLNGYILSTQQAWSQWQAIRLSHIRPLISTEKRTHKPHEYQKYVIPLQFPTVFPVSVPRIGTDGRLRCNSISDSLTSVIVPQLMERECHVEACYFWSNIRSMAGSWMMLRRRRASGASWTRLKASWTQ